MHSWTFKRIRSQSDYYWLPVHAISLVPSVAKRTAVDAKYPIMMNYLDSILGTTPKASSAKTSVLKWRCIGEIMKKLLKRCLNSLENKAIILSMQLESAINHQASRSKTVLKCFRENRFLESRICGFVPNAKISWLLKSKWKFTKPQKFWSFA